jgi:hypothetical protein
MIPSLTCGRHLWLLVLLALLQFSTACYGEVPNAGRFSDHASLSRAGEAECAYLPKILSVPRSISAQQRCALVRVGVQKVEQVLEDLRHPDSKAALNASSVRIEDRTHKDLKSGKVHAYWLLEFDVPNQPRLFTVSFDKRTGVSSPVEVIHRP